VDRATGGSMLQRREWGGEWGRGREGEKRVGLWRERRVGDAGRDVGRGSKENGREGTGYGRGREGLKRERERWGAV
jgi:hypothetical protein